MYPLYNNCNFIIFDFSYILTQRLPTDTILSDASFANLPRTVFLFRYKNTRYFDPRQWRLETNRQFFHSTKPISRPNYRRPDLFCLVPVFDTARQQRVFLAGAPRFLTAEAQLSTTRQ
jgi:hypothetical protein